MTYFWRNSAAKELQHYLQALLADIPEKLILQKLIFAENIKQHDEALTQVLERFDYKGITLNLEKSVFCKNILKYYGFMFSEKGMKPDPEKIEEIRETPVPGNKKALQSFLGLTNYMKRFMHADSIQTYHLLDLLQEDKNYIWTETLDQAFNNLKQSLSSKSCISYFDNHK